VALVLGVTGSYRAAAGGPARLSGLRAEIGEGLAWLWHHRLLRTLCVLIGVSNLMFSAAMAVAVLYALEVLRLGETGYGVLLAAFAGLGLTSSPVAAAAWLVLFGVAIVVWNVITISLRQAIVPATLLGRVTSSYRLVAMGVAPVGAALGGVVAEAFGLRAPFFLAAVVVPLVGLTALRSVSTKAIQLARAADLPAARV